MAQRKGDRKKAGQAGGEATKAKHGPSFYQEIGAKGGASRRKGQGGQNNQNSQNNQSSPGDMNNDSEQ